MTRIALRALLCAALAIAVIPSHVDASITSGSLEFTITADAIAVTNLVYQGTTTASSGSASVAILEFTMDRAVMTGMTMQTQCRLGQALQTTVPATRTADFTGSVTLDVSSIAFTLGGTAYSFSPALDTYPPNDFALTSATLTGVSMTATRTRAAGAALQAMRQRFVAC